MSNLGKYRLYKMLSFTAFIMPFVVIIAMNYQMFIAFEVTKISMYGYLVGIFVVIAVKDKIIGTVRKNPVLTMSIVLFFTSVIMKNFLTELMIISMMGIIGSILSAIFEPVVGVYFNQCFLYNGDRVKKIVSEDISHKEGWKQAYK